MLYIHLNYNNNVLSKNLYKKKLIKIIVLLSSLKKFFSFYQFTSLKTLYYFFTLVNDYLNINKSNK